jgi:hypothetical protein
VIGFHCKKKLTCVEETNLQQHLQP